MPMYHGIDIYNISLANTMNTHSGHKNNGGLQICQNLAHNMLNFFFFKVNCVCMRVSVSC